jgi:ATP-dependent Clp protease protease subunit
VYEEIPSAGDLSDRLLERRTLLVSGNLDSRSSSDAVARLMLLDGLGDDPITVVLSCPDGEYISANALADTVELDGVEVRMLAAGAVGGVALLPFAVGHHRVSQPHATFRLVEPTLELQGRAIDVARETARHGALVAELHQRLGVATGQPPETIAADLRQRRLLTAEQARTYGLVDEIASRRRLRQVPSRRQ